MAVTRCYRKHNSLRGPICRNDGSRIFLEVWVVVLNAPVRDGADLLLNAALPKQGEPHPSDPKALVAELIPWESVESELVWYVDIQYSSDPAGSPGSDEWWRSQRFWQTLVYEKYPLKDLDDKAFLNSAGDPFEQPPAELELHRLLTVKQRRRTHSETEIFPFADKGVVNEDDIVIDGRTWPPFSALVRSWEVGQNWYIDKQAKQIEYWERTVQIEFNPGLWHPVKVLDQGRRCKIIGKAGLHNTRDANGVLDGHLALLHNGYQLDPIWGQEPTLLEYHVYEVMSFSNLIEWLEISPP